MLLSPVSFTDESWLPAADKRELAKQDQHDSTRDPIVLERNALVRSCFTNPSSRHRC